MAKLKVTSTNMEAFKSHLLGKAIRLATIAHENQYDKGGDPYILHSLRVMHRLRTKDAELMAIAVLHDILEDTWVTIQDLKAIECTDRVIDGVVRLTKVAGQSYEEYKAAVKASPDARKVKISDLRDNSDIRRLRGVSEKDIKRMIRYHEFYLELVALEGSEK